MKITKIPLNTEDVTSAWLSNALQVRIDENTFQVTANAQEGTGFLSNLLRVSCQEKETGHELKLIVKLLPESEETRSVVLAHHFDQTEIQTYQKILPECGNAAQELNLKKYLCDYVYGNFGETETKDGGSGYASVLILQDLKPLEYAIVDPLKEFLNYDQIESGLDFMARFHCASRVVEKQHDKRLPQIYSFLKPLDTMKSNSLLYVSIQQCLPAVQGTFAELGTNKELRDKITADYQELIPHTNQIMDTMLTVHEEPWLCANHGDLWPNNVLVNRTSQDIKIIDWQLVFYAEAVRDIAIFIFSSLSPNEMTKANVQRLIGFYFEKFAAYCEQHQIDAMRDPQMRTQFEELFHGLGVFHVFLWFILSLEAYQKDIPRYLRCLEFLHEEMNAIDVVKRLAKL